jgi:hypothetical protein
MNLTIGFIAFFISIVIPGILFRRFYFYGEFSKQFNTKDPVLHSIFFSIVPGIVVQIFCLIIYHLSLGFESSFLNAFVIFRDFTSDGSNGTQEATKSFIDNDIIRFFIYSLATFIFSSFIGFVCSRFIRFQKWDKKFKLFRFKNQWYYIFSGEVLNMKKFEDAHKISFKGNKGVDQNTLMTYADILVSVSEQNDRKELYTGYVADYDLKSDDITQLDKVYLIDTHRYKKKDKVLDENGNEIKNVEIDNEGNPTKSRNRVKVPGDIFILKASNIVNMNLTYIPSKSKKAENEAKKQKQLRKIQVFYLIVVFTIILVHFFYKALALDQTFLSNYFIKTGFWIKFLTILTINQFLSLFTPFENKEKKLSYEFNKVFLARVIMFLVFGLITYFLLK